MTTSLYWNSLWIPVDFSTSGHPSTGIHFVRTGILYCMSSAESDLLPICAYYDSVHLESWITCTHTHTDMYNVTSV